MTAKTVVLETIREYFQKKGRILTAEEYKESPDAPIRFQVVRRAFSTWGRLRQKLGEMTFEEEKPVEVIEPVKVEPTVKPVEVTKPISKTATQVQTKK